MNQSIFNEHSISAATEINENSRKGGWSDKYLTHLPIQKDEIVLVRFLETEALTFYQHYVKDPLLNNGQGAFRNLTCSRDGCPLCATKSEWSKPRWVGAYRVIHLDDPEGPKMRVFSKGVTALTLLEKKQKRLKQQGRDINMCNCEIERSGEKLKTLYTFDFKEPSQISDTYQYPEATDLVDYFKIDMEALIRISQGLTSSAPVGKPVTNTAPVANPAPAANSVPGTGQPVQSGTPVPPASATPNAGTGEKPPF